MKILDLSMPIDEKTPTFPGGPKPEIKQIATIQKNGCNEKRLAINSHFSTHIDAPSHMIVNGKTLNDYPIEKFIGEGIALDVSGQKEIETDLHSVRQGDIVFFVTLHSDKMYERDYFTSNPVLTPKTAQGLVEKQIKIVGLDAPTPDNHPYTLHKLFFMHDILIVENLVNLKKLAGKRFQCYVLPLKIQDADGAPCRVIAVF